MTGTNRELVVAAASLPSRAFTSSLSMKISASIGASCLRREVAVSQETTHGVYRADVARSRFLYRVYRPSRAALLFRMQDATGRPLLSVLPERAPGFMLGSPIVLCAWLPDVAPGSTPILFGNLPRCTRSGTRRRSTAARLRLGLMRPNARRIDDSRMR